METRDPSPCEPVSLKPVKGSLPHVPPYPDAQDVQASFTLDEANDPEEYRCRLELLFSGKLDSGQWKHYLTTDEGEQAALRYRNAIKLAGYSIGFQDWKEKLKVIYAFQRQNKLKFNFIFFMFPEEGRTRVLAGYKVEK